MSATIKVMSFNLRVRATGDGPNCLDYRLNKIMNLLAKEKPDIIGFQEAKDEMMDYLVENLSDYYVLGHGRNANYFGEGIPVAFRKDTFRLHAFQEEWLSFTPDVPQSGHYASLGQSKYPRVCVRADLLHKDCTVPFSFYNMHTDYPADESVRLVECAQVMNHIANNPFKFVMTGDFNARPDSTSIRMICNTAEQLGTVDATQHIKGTFHGFKGECGSHKIDYIFTNLSVDPTQSYDIPDDDSCGCYYSDHHAVCAFVTLD